MTLAYDERAGQWVAFDKVDGRPMLACAETEEEAKAWLNELIQGERNAHH